ncbi:MAG: ATP-binding protein [Clostridia bacterium]|nr:ATP-binding protein [Clostridia bacterium]
MKEITVPAAPDSVETVTAFVNEQLDAIRCPLPVRTQVDIAVDEVFSNIVRYAYGPEKGTATVRADVTDEPLSMTITFIDRGKPYNPLTTAAPDTTLPARQRRIGGLGVFILKNTMDDIAYEYRDGMNILTIRKMF